MNIVLVEDDHYEREDIKAAIREQFPTAVVQTIRTESAFMKALNTFVQRPDIFLIDIMLRWTDPSPDITMPPPNCSFLDAGFRCAEELQKVMPGVPTVLYTVLDNQDIQARRKKLARDVRYVRKSSDLRPLYDAIRELTQP